MSETQQLAPTNTHPMVRFYAWLDSREPELKKMLPDHIKPEQFVRVVKTLANKNPDLLACDRHSLWIACMDCCRDGLLPDGQEAAIVPYKDKATYIPMWQGLIKRFRNSGQFKTFSVGIVREGDEWDHWLDEHGEHFRYRRGDQHSDQRAIRCVFATATTKDGGVFIVDPTLDQINKRKNMSRAKRDDAPWKVWPEEMMKKTAVRMLAPLLPKSSDIVAMLQRDDDEADLAEVAAAEPTVERERLNTMQALDAFADETERPDTAAETPAEKPSAAAATTQETSEEKGESLPQGTEPPASSHPEAITSAYTRGKQWRSQGKNRKAVPGEFRAAERQREAVAWLAGYDGRPLPSFHDDDDNQDELR